MARVRVAAQIACAENSLLAIVANGRLDPDPGADAEAVLRLIESLDELDDVQKVDANFDIDASVMSGLQS